MGETKGQKIPWSLGHGESPLTYRTGYAGRVQQRNAPILVKRTYRMAEALPHWLNGR
jgi:hypothetical protein